jgi:hypothetical protein
MSGITNEVCSEQTAKNKKYRSEYEAWMQSLSPEERDKARGMGVDRPLDDHYCGGRSFADISDLKLADESAGLETLVEQNEVESEKDKADERWYYIRPVIALILSEAGSETSRARLAVECLCIASGMGDIIESVTEVDIARRHGLSRQAVSKRVKNLTKLLGTKPSIGMRSLKACKKYREARNRAKYQ